MENTINLGVKREKYGTDGQSLIYFIKDLNWDLNLELNKPCLWLRSVYKSTLYFPVIYKILQTTKLLLSLQEE